MTSGGDTPIQEGFPQQPFDSDSDSDSDSEDAERVLCPSAPVPLCHVEACSRFREEERDRERNCRSRCHPERSAFGAKSKDLRSGMVPFHLIDPSTAPPVGLRSG